MKISRSRKCLLCPHFAIESNYFCENCIKKGLKVRMLALKKERKLKYKNCNKQEGGQHN